MSDNERTIVEKYKEYMTPGANVEANQKVYRFPNGWGASVLCGFGSYGLEMMPIYLLDEGCEFLLVFSEPYGYLTDKSLEEHLDDIFENGKDSKCSIQSRM